MSRRRPQVENSSLLRPLLKIAARPTTGLGSLGPFNRTTGAHSRQHQPDLSTLLHALLDRPNSNLITSPQPIPSLGPIPVTSRISVDVVKDPEARRRLSVHHKIQRSGKQDVTAKILRRHASTRHHQQKEKKIYKQSKERGGEMGDRSEIPGFSGASNRIFDLQQPPQVPRRPKPRDVEKSHNYETYYSLPPPALPSQPKPLFMEPQPSTTNSSGFPFASGPIPTGPFRLSSIPENEAADTFEEWQQIALRRQKGRRRTTRPRLSSDYDIDAERLNLYLEKDEGEIENIDEDGIHKDAAKDKTWRKRLKPILPHVGLVILSAFYTLVGAGIFHYFEKPFEELLRNQTSQRVHDLKQKIIDQLWTTRLNESLDTWGRMAHDGMDAIIRDVFHDYTKYYMTPDDIITGSGHIKWSFGSSIFFAWTAITTIGYGHIVPLSFEGRLAIIFYALLGIPLILVTIADIGRFLSGGIIKIHNIYSDFMEECRSQCWKAMRKICCKFKRKSRPHIPMPTIELLQRQHKLYGNNAPGGQRQSQGAPGSGRKRRQRDNVSDAGTFDDISDIHTQNSESGEMSEDTKARAEEIEAPQPHHERRVSVIFILLIMIGYVAGGAYLIRFWEAWTYFDAFYFCFVTVTTIGFGDIVAMNVDFLPLTLAYIVFGLIITTMCIDLVGSEYIRDIHFYGRSLGKSFMTIGGKVVHLHEVFGYVAFLQKNYGLTPDQLNKLAQLPEEYLLDCLINGRQPDLNWIGGRPYVPPDIYYFKWIEHPRTLSFASDRVLASMESLDLNTSRCSTARTLTPREYYQKILFQYCKQIQPEEPIMDIDR